MDRKTIIMAMKLAKPIHTLGLSIHVCIAIRKYTDIDSIVDMYMYHIRYSQVGTKGNRGINRIRNIGEKAKIEIDDALVKNGLPTLDQALTLIGG